MRDEAAHRGESEGLGIGARRGRDADGVSLQVKLDRLEELREKIEASRSIEEATDLLVEFDAAVKDLIDALGSEHEGDAKP